MPDPMESFKLSCRPVQGARHTIVSDERFATMLRAQHARWGRVSPELGVPLDLVRAAGQWEPIGPLYEQAAWARMSHGFPSEAPKQHQGSRRVGPPRSSL